MKSIKFIKIKKNIKNYIHLAKRLKNDKRIPKISRILLGLAIAYFFIPIDIIPDFIPLIGHLDDAIIIPTLLYLAVKFIPEKLYQDYTKIFKN